VFIDMTFCDQAKLTAFMDRGQKAQAAVDKALDLFGEPLKPVAPTRGQPKGYAAIPGTGPKDETCGSCAHCYYTRSRGEKRFNKCDLVKATNGPGTDIRRKAAACWHWRSRPAAEEKTSTNKK
jgi:hypothetical protein